MSKRFQHAYIDLLLLGALFLIAVLPFWDILVQNDQLIYSSDINYFFSQEIINRKLLSDSTFPLWNPYFGGGSPQLGKIQGGMLYPPSLALRWLPVVPMFNWDAVLHLFFAGAGVFLLLRHWQVRRVSAFVGGIIFMFSGALLPRFMIGHVSVVHVIAWLGWLMLAYDRLLHKHAWGDLLLTTWFTLLIILGGHPQMSVLVLLVPVTYLLFVILPSYLKETAWKTAVLAIINSSLVALLSLGLLSIQLFPFLEWFEQTSRGQGSAINNLALMTSYSLNPEYLITLITPLLWFSPTTHQTISIINFSHFWEASPFITLTGLFLLFLGAGVVAQTENRRLIRYLVGLALAGLLLSMGNHNPVYDILYAYYPYFRAPGRFLIWWTFAAALLVGFTLDGLQRVSLTRVQWLKIGKQTAVVMLVFCLLVWGGFTVWGSTWLDTLQTLGTFSAEDSLIAREAVPRSLQLLTATTLSLFVLFWLAQSKRLSHNQWELGILLLIVAESFAFARLQIQPYPVSNLRQIDSPLAQLAIDPAEVRIDGYRMPPTYYVPTLKHILNGEEYFALERLLNEDTERGQQLFSAGFLATNEPLADANFQLVQQKDSAYLYEHVANLPRIYAASSIKPVGSDDEALAFVTAEEFMPAQQAVITLQDGETPPNLAVNSGETAVFTAKYTQYKNNSLTAEVTTDRPVLVLFSELDYPGWEATLDDEVVPIYRSNYTFRGIALEAPGSYQIEMQFRPQAYQNGRMVTGITAVLIILITITLFLRKRTAHKKNEYSQSAVNSLSS